MGWRKEELVQLEELQRGIYREVVPLKGNPLKTMNIYGVQSLGETMIIDTGFDQEEIKEEFFKFLETLRARPQSTILFITHLHSDHNGLANAFVEWGGQIVTSKEDGALSQEMIDPDGSYWTWLKTNAKYQGFKPGELDLNDHPGFKYRPKAAFPFKVVEPGDKFGVGDFEFQVIDENGHTPGMVGLYDEKRKILFAGDMVLDEITPNISFWGPYMDNSLGAYIENLNKIEKLDLDIIYPSHRKDITDISGRIRELKDHHSARLYEVLQILRDRDTSTVEDVASRMHWDIDVEAWEDFPKSQKWFAAGEAQAHLEFLRAVYYAEGATDDRGIYYYFLTPRGKKVDKLEIK